MKYRHLFRTVFFQLLLAGFASMAATGKLGAATVVGYLALLALAWWKGEQFSERHRSFRGWQVLGLLVLFLAFFVLDFASLSGEFTLAVIHVALAVSILKLFTCNTPRDYFYIFLIAFGFLLVSTTFTIDLSFLLFASWFMVSGILALMLFEIRNASLEFSRREEPDGAAAAVRSPLDPAFPGRITFSPRVMLGLGAVTYGAILLLTVPLFAILPRLSFGFWQLDLSRQQEISGFAYETRLGDVTSIKLNPTVVMRIKTDIPPEQLPPDLKWKGIALDHYDGRGWSLAEPRRISLEMDRSGLFQIRPRRSPERLLYQEFYLEPITSRVLFLASRQLAVTRDAQSVSVTMTGTLVKNFEHMVKFKYAGYSDIRRPTDAELEAETGELPPGFARSLLEIPDRSPRIVELVNRITAGETSPWRKAKALEQYLRSHYAYSLEMPPCPPDRDPVEFFLFDMKQGHCEYFASALALMLRYTGIPSMVVNGFQRGDVNPFSGVFVVRQSDAHSWVEAYMGRHGWIELDATPPGIQPGRTGWLAVVEDLVDSIQFMWIQDVVNYDVGDQVRLFRDLRQRTTAFKQFLAAWFQSVQDWIESVWDTAWLRWESGALRVDRMGRLGFLLMALLALLGLLALLRRRFGLRLGRGAAAARRGSAVWLYQRFLHLAARAGWTKPDGETPREFAVRLRDHFPPGSVEEFTDVYYELRFDRRCRRADVAGRLADLLKRLEIELRPRKHTASKAASTH
jgi:hypothetical protein